MPGNLLYLYTDKPGPSKVGQGVAAELVGFRYKSENFRSRQSRGNEADICDASGRL